MPLVSSAYNWFNLSLEIYTPKTVASFVPHLLDKNPDFEKLVNETIPQMKTGISKLIVKKDGGFRAAVAFFQKVDAVFVHSCPSFRFFGSIVV